MSTPDHDPLVGTVIADRYQILELIGEGGMGRVYLAEHVRMGRKSAVKVMSPNLALSADAISRFNREAANACKINNPNVAQIYDFGETSDGMLYLAMEFVEGETLREIIQRDGPIPLPRAANLTKQIGDALAAAHHLGIVHRDLKPDNVMIAKHHDGSDWVKVVDFGIAKTVQGSGDPGAGSQTVTTAGVSLGTPEYMSPEQLAGERLDSRTDLYSLGLVLFNMLTADLPYPRVTSKETLVRRLTSHPRSLADVAPNAPWPAALQDALDRAMAPETADRYASVVDFTRDVTAAVASYDADKTQRVLPPRLSAPTQRIAVPAPAARVAGEPPRAPKAALVAAGVLLVVGAIGAGAFVAYRQREPAVPSPAPAVASAPAAVLRPSDTALTKPAAKSVDKPVQKVAETAAAKPADTAPISAQALKLPPIRGAAEPPGRVVFVPGDRRVKYDSLNVGTPRVERHAWLRPNGDSGSARPLSANPTDAERINYFVQEIRAHSMRANLLIGKANVGGARNEFRDIGGEVQMFRELYPAAADSLRIGEQVQRAGMRLVQQCNMARADSTKRFPPNFTCEQLLPGLGRGRQGAGRQGGFNRPPKP